MSLSYQSRVWIDYVSDIMPQLV